MACYDVKQDVRSSAVNPGQGEDRTGHQGHPLTFTQPMRHCCASWVKSGFASSLAGASADCRLFVHKPGVCLPSDLSTDTTGWAAGSAAASSATRGCTAAVICVIPPPGRHRTMASATCACTGTPRTPRGTAFCGCQSHTLCTTEPYEGFEACGRPGEASRGRALQPGAVSELALAILE